MLPFTLRQLEYIVAVADTGHFGRAAARCGVSQPSLSAQVALVEESIAFTIFERNRSGTLVHRQAEAFVGAARNLVGRAVDLAQLAAGHDPLAGELRLGVIPTIAPYALPLLSPMFAEAFPKLRIIWTEERTPTLVTLIEQGSLDGGLLAIEAELGSLDALVIGVDPFLLAVPKGHPLADRETIDSVAVLEDLPVLVLDDGHCLRDQTLAACGRRAPEGQAATYRSTSLATLIELVAQDAGVTLLPRLALRHGPAHPRTKAIPFAGEAPSRTLGFVTRSASPTLGTLRALVPITRRALLDV